MDRIATEHELADDGTELCRIVVPKDVATKKTHQRIVYVRSKGARRKRPIIIPSEQFLNYEIHCKSFMEEAWVAHGHPPMDFGVSVTFQVWLSRWIEPDATGVMQSLGDILEKHGVIANDSWLHWDNGPVHWFGGVDRENPRTEIVLKRFRHPTENYRAQKLALAIQEEEARQLRAQQRIERAEQRAREAAEKAARREAREAARAAKLAEQEAKRAARASRKAAPADSVSDGETREI